MFGVLGGVATAVLFNIPFVLVSKAEQYHLLAAGAALAFTGGALGVVDAFRARVWRLAATVVVVAGLAAMAAVSRHIATDFEPYGPIVLRHDEIVQQWAAVPEEIRAYLANKRQPAARDRLSSNPIDAVPLVTWGLLGREVEPKGTEYRWLGGRRAHILVTRQALSVDIPVRHLIEFTRTPALVQLMADGRLVDQATLKESDWHVLQSRLRRDWVGAIWGMHRLELTVDRTWTPVDVIPGSTDARVFGVQVGKIESH